MPTIQIPDNTNSIHNIGEFIMSYQPYQNAFLSALVNRIGRVLVTSKMWNNPWSVFKRGMMDFGETVEEVFVNIAKPHGFDQAAAEKNIFVREMPDVRAAFHTMNFQKYYKVTISNDQLRQAFLSWDGITDLISRIVDSLYTGMNYDEYITMKYMLCRAALNGDISTVKCAEATPENMPSVVTSFKAISNKLTFLSNNYNMAAVANATPKTEQYLIIDTEAEASMQVEVLATAFNMSMAEFMGHVIEIDSFVEHDWERLDLLFDGDAEYKHFDGGQLTVLGSIPAMLTAENFWMVFDNYQNFTQNYNGEGLYWNYWYHVWKTFSVSPFANAAVFTSTDSTVTGVTVSPASSNVTQGADLVLTADVAGTGIYTKAVTWTMEGATKSGTTLVGNKLHVAADEPADTVITVKATSVFDQSKNGTSTITVTSAA